MPAGLTPAASTASTTSTSSTSTRPGPDSAGIRLARGSRASGTPSREDHTRFKRCRVAR
ncbi:MAG: hypothetical protein ABSB59_27515 [Streptosporangiaceae bacterium]